MTPRALSPDTANRITSSERASQGKAEMKKASDERVSREERRVNDEKTSAVERAIPLLPSDAETRQQKAATTRDNTEEPVVDQPTADKRLENAEQKQSDLLRKADDFMNRLFDRPRPTTAPDAKVDHEGKNTEPSPITLEEPTRLQPVQSTPRKIEQETEPPSLVIGKLTVEVLPPTPAPTAPQQSIVLIGGGKNSRTGLPSSRRFGLGQF